MVGTCLLNRYELTGEFGRGGMGVVYRAHDRVLDRDVAVKILFVSHLTAAGEDRFAREAQLVAQLDHPGVVPIYDFGRHEETLFFVMPVVAGTTLDRRIRDRTLYRWEAIEIVAQVAEALDHSHARGVIHRDVKPQNIMVASGEDGPRARILDFGIALGSAVSRLTHSGHLAGTLLYLSPEQITSEVTDARSDLYSLGTVLYECLIGRPPFQGTRFSLLYRIVHEPPPALAVCGIDRGLEELVLACLAKTPAARPRRGRDFALSLRRYLETLGPEERGREIPSSPPAAAPRSPRIELSGPEEPLVGRDREITELHGRLNAARDGECQLALVGGEIGMGKTRLVEELGRFAQLRGIRVLRSHFSDEAAFPYQGFCELIQDYFRGKEPPASASSGIVDLGDLAPDLLALYPVLSEIRILREAARGKTASELAGERGDRRHLFEILARTLARLAGGKPVVFLLERLHAAEASIAALHYVVHRLGPTPTLVVGTYRPSATPKEHPLRRLILGFQGNPRFCALRLEALSPSRHRDLVRHLIGRKRPEITAELAQRLYETTEGNPLFTRELVRSLLKSGGFLPDPNGTWKLSDDSGLASDALPETIQRIVGKRLEQLPEELLETLTVASVLGREFEFADLAALAADAGSEGKVDEAVDRLIGEGLLEEDRQSRSDRLHFSSRVVRDVLYGRLSRRKRRRGHRRHAAQLERRYAGRTESIYPQLLHHYAAADVPEKTVDYGLKLGRQALAACSAEDAVRAAAVGIEFVGSDELLDRGELEGELRYTLAAAHRLAGGFDQALAEVALAVRCFERAEAPERAAAAALMAAETAWQGRRVEDTRRWVETGIRLARAVGAGEALRKLLTLGATVANMHGEYARGKVFLAEAAELARQSAPPADDLSTGGTAVTAVTNAVATRDREAFAPYHLETTDDLEILANVFETLLRTDADGRLVPWLAREWEGSAAGDAFRLTLRSDVRFSDATPLIAADVKRSCERRARRKPMAAPADLAIAGMREFIAGAADEVTGIRLHDDRVVEFVLVEPLPLFPALLADLRTAIARQGEEGTLLGTGPFRLVAHREDRIVLERNPNGWRPALVPLDRVEFVTSLDARGIAAGLRAGELDIGRDLVPADLEALVRDPRFRSGLSESVRNDIYFVLFNGNGPLTRDPRVREALAGVVRVQEIVWRTLGRFAQPALGWLPPGLLGHDPGRRRTAIPPPRAAALLREAGFEPPIRLRAAVHPLLRDRYGALTEALFEDWSQLGVEVRIGEPTAGESPLEWFLARARDCEEIDLWISRWEPDYNDPDNLTYSLLHSRHGEFSGYVASSELDGLLEEARREGRAPVRQRLYQQFEQLLLDTHAVLPLFHEVDYRIFGPQIRGLRLLSTPPYVNYSQLSKASPGETITPAGPGERPRGAVLVPLATAFDKLDPELGFLADPTEVIPNVFETLTRVDEGAHVVPCLAAEFRVEDGGRRFRFRLRENVRFHDGRRLTARDVRYSFERVLGSRRPGSEIALVPIRGARDLLEHRASELAGLTIVSALELVVELERPMPSFPGRLAHPTTGIFPEGSENFTGSWREGCVGTGPFRVLSFEPGKWVELQANPNYWRNGYPSCERLIFELGVSPERVASGFRSGRFSLAANLRVAELETLRHDARFAAGYCESPGLSTYYLMFNAHRGPLGDPELRRTLARALDVAGPVRSIGRLGTPAHGLIPPGLLGYEARRSTTSPPVGSGGLEGLGLTALVHPVFQGLYSPLWEKLCRSFDELGVRLRVTCQSADNLCTATITEDADVVATRWLADFPDSDTFVSLFDSRTGADGGFFGNEAIDRLIEAGRSEADPALRNAIYRELEGILAHDAFVVPLFHEQVYRFARPELQGLKLRIRCPEVAYEELTLTG